MNLNSMAYCSLMLLGFGSPCLASEMTTPLSPQGSHASALSARPSVEQLTEYQIGLIFPGSLLVSSRDVFSPDGFPLGSLLTYRVGEGEPDNSPALFSGAGYFSVLVADDPGLPLWMTSTSGTPAGFPEDVSLVWSSARQAWLYFDGDILFDAETGVEVKPANYAGSMVAATERQANIAARQWAESEWSERSTPNACSGNYGSVLGTFATQNAYSNGSCSGTGSGTYQCVEFTDRVHKVTVSHSGNANTYNDGTNPRKMNMMYFKNNNGTYVPMMGDIAVSDGGTYGHVAVFTNNCTSGKMTLMDQNWSSSSATHQVTCSSTSIGTMSSSYPVAGWLRPGWDFTNAIDSTSSVYGWSLRNFRIASVDSTGINLDPGSDPGLVSPSGLNLNPVPPSKSGQGYATVKVRMKSKAPDGNVQLFFTTSNENYYDDKKSAKATIKNDGTWQIAQFNMGDNGYWVYGGRVNQLRVDPAGNGNSGTTDLISIDSIWLQP